MRGAKTGLHMRVVSGRACHAPPRAAPRRRSAGCPRGSLPWLLEGCTHASTSAVGFGNRKEGAKTTITTSSPLSPGAWRWRLHIRRRRRGLAPTTFCLPSLLFLQKLQQGSPPPNHVNHGQVLYRTVNYALKTLRSTVIVHCKCDGVNGGRVLRRNFCWYYKRFCFCYKQFIGSLQTMLTINFFVRGLLISYQQIVCVTKEIVRIIN